jgi:hypothetical protein
MSLRYAARMIVDNALLTEVNRGYLRRDDDHDHDVGGKWRVIAHRQFSSMGVQGALPWDLAYRRLRIAEHATTRANGPVSPRLDVMALVLRSLTLVATTTMRRACRRDRPSSTAAPNPRIERPRRQHRSRVQTRVERTIIVIAACLTRSAPKRRSDRSRPTVRQLPDVITYAMMLS